MYSIDVNDLYEPMIWLDDMNVFSGERKACDMNTFSAQDDAPFSWVSLTLLSIDKGASMKVKIVNKYEQYWVKFLQFLYLRVCIRFYSPK